MRYAVYLTPSWESALADSARRWLGRCAFTGKNFPPAAPASANVEVPARYGFHGTMRAPFRLADGSEEATLSRALQAFAARQGLIETPLEVGVLSNFVALLPVDNAPLAEAAMAALQTFEPYRAPLNETERARRNPDAMDDRGRELLDRWGYHHVEERFRYHMTLTGPLASQDIEAVEAAAREHFAPFTDGTLQELEFALFAEPAAREAFRVIATASEA